MSSNVSELIEEGLGNSMAQEEYYSLIDRLHEQSKATGPNPTESYFGYSKLNLQRIKRIRRTTKISDELAEAVSNIKEPQIWLVITESWCGDAAQSIPVYEAVAGINDKVEIRYVLRDENTDLIDQFLTNGGRAIPIVLLLNADTGALLGKWGARPAQAQEYFMEMKSDGVDGSEISENLQRWYNKNKQVLIQEELVSVLKNIRETEAASV